MNTAWAMPSLPVTAVNGATKLPPLGSARIENCTVAPLTRLLATVPSRTTAIRLLRSPLPTSAASACRLTWALLPSKATNSIFVLPLGPPATRASIVLTPALPERIQAPGKAPPTRLIEPASATLQPASLYKSPREAFKATLPDWAAPLIM